MANNYESDDRVQSLKDLIKSFLTLLDKKYTLSAVAEKVNYLIVDVQVR